MRVAKVQIEDGSRIQAIAAPELAVHEGDQCVIQVDRVLEFGRILRLETLEEGAGQKPAGSVLRCATLQDQAKAKESMVMSRMAREKVTAMVAKHKLNIKPIRVRYSLDRAALMVQFVADEHPDYRDFIRDLSSEVNARIDIRQIGVRDEAALLGGAGPCGRPLCCCSWLQHFESINVKMAKTQGISLNPNAISGMCGRLKCCLGYEYEEYRRLERQLPREGTPLQCPEGSGVVCGRDILRQRVRVALPDNRMVECGVDECRPEGRERREQTEEPGHEDPGAERSES